MNILLVNDDGIYAQGIRTLARVLSRKHKITVVAPNREMSGTGHGVTFGNYMHFAKLDLVEGADCYTITGTPADCAKFGAEFLLKGERPDLIISGINDGCNLGTEVIYSGTVNAALEGAVLGIPSLAVSQKSGLRDFAFSAEFVADNLDRLVALLPEDCSYIVSVNLPCDCAEEVKGIRFATLGVTRHDVQYVDCGLKGHYITGKSADDIVNGAETDVACVEAGYIALTPVKSDFNDYDAYERLKDLTL